MAGKAMTQAAPRVVFFGTPDFALSFCETFFDNFSEGSLVAVVTAQDKPAGRGQGVRPSAVKLWAQKRNIPVLQPDQLSDLGFVSQLRNLRPTVGVIAAYGKIIPPPVLKLFPKGILNVHPSLLPRWRGPSPIQSAIASGDSETGVTILLTTERMDAGPILAQERVPLNSQETSEMLHRKLFAQGALLLKDTLPRWLSGTVESRKQDEKAATYSRLLTREDGRADWQQPGAMFTNRVRAYHPWPGMFTFLPDGSRIKILSASFLQETAEPPGTIRGDGDTFQVAVPDGWIELEEIQVEGQRSLPGKSFLRDHSEVRGQVLR